MRKLWRSIMAAGWTGALILTVVVAVDGQEHARYDQEVREDVRTQVDLVRSDLETALDRRVTLADRLVSFVVAEENVSEERFRSVASSLILGQQGVRGLHLVPNESPSLHHPEGTLAGFDEHDGAAAGDPRVLGPYALPTGARALSVVSPVMLSGVGGAEVHWGFVLVEFYLEPLLGEARISGWPGDASFAIRGADGLGEAGAAFVGDPDVFEEDAVTSIVAFRGGQWQLGATPIGGWPDVAPATWWIRISGGVLALLGSVLVGVLVSEPVRLRDAVRVATRTAEENEERFRSVSDTAHDGIVTIDADGRITYANRAMEHLYGYRREDLLGAHIGDRLGPEWSLLEASVGEPLGISSVALSTRRRDGASVQVELSASSWSLGDEIYQTAIIRDVTERNRVQEEQARLAAVLDSTPDLVAIADPRGRLQYVNRAARRAFGIDGDLDGPALVELFPENARRGFWEEALLQTLREGAWRGETTLLAADGERIPVSQVLLAHHDDEGRVSAVALVARDISEEKKAEAELHREKERFRTLAEAAFEGIVIHDNGEILEANQAFARLAGRPIEELVGSHIIDLVAPESRANVQARLKTPDDSPYEIEMCRADGSSLTVEVAAKHFPFRDRIVRVTAVRDVTERKKAEMAQRVAIERLSEIERLKEIDQFKTQLLNTASHELNTPITPIRLQVHLLKNSHLGDLSPRHQKAIGVLDRNVERLAALVQDVLDVARLQSGRLKVNKEPLEVSSVVMEAVEAFEEPAAQARIRIEVDAESDLWVVGDGHRLTQVLFNLFSNALKFTPADGLIRVRIRGQHGRAVVRVEDNGKGLAEQQIRRLFRPFSQVHDTMQTTVGGTGLGLYISKGILEEHDGSIWCESEGPGRGATFGFSIPLATSAELEKTETAQDGARDIKPDLSGVKNAEGGMNGGVWTGR